MSTPKDGGVEKPDLQTQLLDSAQEALIVHDLEGKLVLFNEAAHRERGYSREEFAELTLKDLDISELVDLVGDRVEELAKKGETRFRTTSRRKDESRFPVEVRVKVVEQEERKLVLSCIRDISESREAELEYGAILRTAMDGFWVSDLDNRFLDVNDSFCWMVGYTREELLQMSFEGIEPHEDSGEIARHFDRVAEEGYSRFEARHRCKDGQVLNVEVAAYYLDVEDARFYVFVRDITERKQADRAIRKLNHRLQEQVQRQKQSIEALSTPVIRLWDQIVLLPLVGTIDPNRAQQLTENLLEAIADQRALVALVDVTGVPVVNEKVAMHLLETVTAAKLLGAKVLITGISPALARTLVDLEVDISRLDTQATLQAGIIQALGLVGLGVMDG